MKNIKILAFLIVLLVGYVMATDGQIYQEKCETIYQRWNQILDSNLFLTEPMWFSTNNLLAPVVGEIQSNKIAMAYFLCDRMAKTQYTNTQANPNNRLYRDVHFLRNVAGIDLIYATNNPAIEQNIGENISKFSAQFQEEWRAGVYKDPSKQIKELCKARLSQEGEDSIDPRALIAIRRYGIFGIPELVRQIKQHNSKHAFAAYLIISGQRENYADYIRKSREQFTTKDAKIEDMKQKVEEMKATSGGEPDVVNRIEASLRE